MTLQWKNKPQVETVRGLLTARPALLSFYAGIGLCFNDGEPEGIIEYHDRIKCARSVIMARSINIATV